MPELMEKQDAVKSQATLKKVDEDLEKDGAQNKQQNYARSEQVKAKAAKEAEEAQARKKLKVTDKQVQTLEKQKQQLEKKQAAKKKQKQPVEEQKDAAEKNKEKFADDEEQVETAKIDRGEKVQDQRMPDKESLKAEKEKGEQVIEAKQEKAEEAQEVRKEQQEEAKAGKGETPAVEAAKAKVDKVDPDSVTLSKVNSDLSRAYIQQQLLLKQLIAILTGLAGLETNVEKRRKLQGEVKKALTPQLLALKEKQADLEAAAS